MENKLNPSVLGIPEPASVAIADKVRRYMREGISVAQMQTGDPFFPTPAYIIEGAREAMEKGQTHYSTSQGIIELREQLAIQYKESYAKEFSPSQIFIGSGAIHAIFCVMSAILEPGDEVIIPEPLWPQYQYTGILLGANVKTVDTSENNARFTPAMLEQTITPKTKLLIINNPCNPSGIVYGKEEIEAFLEIAAQKNVFVLFDEVYNNIVFTHDYCPVFRASNYEQYKDVVIYVNSFSKTYAMSGWRVGYAILPPSLVSSVLKVSQLSVTNTNTFCQYGALIALKKRKEHEILFTQFNQVYRQRYEELKSLLDTKGISYIQPGGTFYFFIQCPIPSVQFSIDLLETQRIAVVPGIAYGEHFDHYYRISYAVDEKSYEIFLNRGIL